MLLKIYLICVWCNVIYLCVRENVYDRRHGLTVGGFLEVLGLVLTGPLGSLAFAVIIWGELKEAWPKIMSYHIIKPVKPKPIVRTVS